MKFRAERAPLADALAWVAQAVPKKPAAPCLSGIRLAAEDDALVLSAFDYEVAHTARVPAEVIEADECLIPGAFLRSLVGSLRSKEVEVVRDGREVTVSGGRSTYRTRTMLLEDYPNLPEPPEAVGTVEAGDLLAAVSAVSHPVDDGSPHEQVRGLRIEADEACLTFVGMDRFRIAAAELDWSGEHFGITVPGRPLLAAAKGMTGAVSIGVRGNGLGLADETRTVVQRTFGEGFTPLWRKLLERSDGPTVTLPADDLAEAVKRAGSLTEDEAPISLAFGGGEVRIGVEGDRGAGSDVLEAATEGEGSGDFDPAYLSDALAVIPSGNVRITYPAGNRPWLIDPTDHPTIRLAVMGKRGKA